MVSPNVHKQTLSKELIANHLYVPSYISFENALSFYKLIPERVYSIRSMTTKRGKTFSTPLGNFEYISTAADYFEIGIKQERSDFDLSFPVFINDAFERLITTNKGKVH